MIDRLLGLGAALGFAICACLFGARLVSLVTPYSPAYAPVNAAFACTFAAAGLLGSILAGRLVFARTSGLHAPRRLAISIGASMVFAAVSAFAGLVGCVGMNFVGQ